MKLTIEPTDRIVELVASDLASARVWQGETDDGVPVHVFICRVAVKEGLPPETYRAFEQALQKTAPMRPEIRAIDLRYVI